MSVKELTKVEETEEKTESVERDAFDKEIKIQVNKNKRILEHLTKFSQDIDEIKDKEGMSLLFYDFNGFKSSLS